jgi:hypothetical protein
VASCRDPTEVTLVLTTDVPCTMLNETSITIAQPNEDVESKPPVTLTNLCDPTGSGDHTIGTFVVIPNSTGSSEAFSVRVVSAVYKKLAKDCVASDQYTGCIIARRELAFVPHTPLTLPIAMRLDCLDVPCMPGQSCVLGSCKSDVVDPPKCATACGEQTLGPPDGGSPEASPPADAPAEATQGDAPPSDGPLDSTPLADVSTSADVSTADGPILDATTSDGPDGMPATDAPPPDVSVDAPVDAPVEAQIDAAGPDASPDATVVDAGVFDGGYESDATPLGSCLGNGASSGVACGGGTCALGQVCCISFPSSGLATETCTSSSACNFNLAGTGVRYSSLACRNRGDCATGVCCVNPSGVTGAGMATTCTGTCSNTFSQRVACRHDCECGGLTCGATSCVGGYYGTCGGVCP